MKKIVVIGGGTGSFTVLSGLKKLPNIDLTAVVASTDSGGSTGRLRDEFGFLPVGDIRQCLVALAENKEEQMLLRKLFNYRFDKGEDGLKGHNLGNLFMTALRDILGDEIKAIEEAKKLFNVKGDIYPVTLEKCDLVAEYENGEVIEGQHNIDKPGFPHDCRQRITKFYTKPKVKSHKKVKEVILNADLIIIGPGDLYTSLIANLIINNISSYIRKTKAKLIYVLNLTTKFGQTFGFKASNHLNEIEKYLSRKVDHILINSTPLPKDILDKYKLESAFEVINDLNKDSRAIIADFLATEKIQTVKGDMLKRSLIRHDGNKIAETIKNLI